MIFLKSTAATLAPGVFMVDVAAKPPGRTFSIFMAVDGETPPDAILKGLEGLGYKRMKSAEYVHQDGKKVLDLQFHKIGTDIFDGWTVAEKESNLKALEDLFGASNIKFTPRVMSLAEAF